MSKETRRQYTAPFKAEAVGLVTRKGYRLSDAARAPGINRGWNGSD